MFLSKKHLLELWEIVLKACFIVVLMMFFHIPEKMHNYIEHSKNIEKAREILNMIEKQPKPDIRIKSLTTENGDQIV